MTLPLIYALNQASKSDKRHIIHLIKNKSEETQKVNEVITFVKDSGGIEYANQVMQNYRQEAEDFLTHFPDSDYKNSLRTLIQYTIERNK